MKLVPTMATVYSIFLYFAYVYSTIVRSEFFIYREQMKEKVYTTGVITVNGRMECIVQCKNLADGNCIAASYNLESNLCRLYDDRSDKKIPKVDKGWYTWSVFSGCGPPPEVPNADVFFGGDFLNALAIYTCKSDFKPCDLQTESRCLANGKWTAISGGCSQYRWRNPVVRFEESLPCQDQNMTHIRIKATPTKETRMTFALTSDKDYLLIASSRFNYQDGVNQLLLNTQLSGKYGVEVKPSGFPFTVNKTFTMEITLSSGIYQITVGDQIWKFKERSTGVAPKKFIVAYDVNLKLVEIP